MCRGLSLAESYTKPLGMKHMRIGHRCGATCNLTDSCLYWLCFSSREESDVCIFVGNTATLSMDRAMAWVERLDIFEDVVGDYIISSANT